MPLWIKFRLQKRVARLILDVDNDTSSAIVFRQLKWMSVFQRIFYQKCILLFNIVNDFSPQYLKKLIVYQCILNVPFPKLSLCKKSLQYSGAHIWNMLPQDVRNAPSLSVFKLKCKLFIQDNVHFIQKYLSESTKFVLIILITQL